MPLDGPSVIAVSPPPRLATAAPLWRRFAAWLVDGALALAPIVLAVGVTSAGTARTIQLSVAILTSLLVVIINDFALVVRQGQSIGRRWLAVKVLDGHSMRPPSLGQVILRNIVGGAQFGIAWHPFGFLPSFVIVVGPWPLICYGPAVADRRWHRGLNDRWAHTVVIDVLTERSL